MKKNSVAESFIEFRGIVPPPKSVYHADGIAKGHSIPPGVVDGGFLIPVEENRAALVATNGRVLLVTGFCGVYATEAAHDLFFGFRPDGFRRPLYVPREVLDRIPKAKAKSVVWRSGHTWVVEMKREGSIMIAGSPTRMPWEAVNASPVFPPVNIVVNGFSETEDFLGADGIRIGVASLGSLVELARSIEASEITLRYRPFDISPQATFSHRTAVVEMGPGNGAMMIHDADCPGASGYATVSFPYVVDHGSRDLLRRTLFAIAQCGVVSPPLGVAPESRSEFVEGSPFSRTARVTSFSAPFSFPHLAPRKKGKRK